MPVLTVAHDVICPWCWVAWQQSKRLLAEFPTLSLRWVGYELLPEGMEYTPAPPDPKAERKPRVPERFELMLEAEKLTLPERTRERSISRRALEGAEFAYEMGKANAYLDALYHAYWEESRDIANFAVLDQIAQTAGLETVPFLHALETHRYRDRVIEYDEPAYAAGVWNVPTWMFPEEWVAEQPYRVVRELTERFVRST